MCAYVCIYGWMDGYHGCRVRETAPMLIVIENLWRGKHGDGRRSKDADSCWDWDKRDGMGQNAREGKGREGTTVPLIVRSTAAMQCNAICVCTSLSRTRLFKLSTLHDDRGIKRHACR